MPRIYRYCSNSLPTFLVLPEYLEPSFLVPIFMRYLNQRQSHRGRYPIGETRRHATEFELFNCSTE